MSDIKLTYNGSIKDGKISLPKNMANEMIQAFDGKQIEVTVRRKRKRRSNPQNAYLWGVVYQTIVNYLNAEGDEYYTVEDIHSLMGYSFLLKDTYDPNTGEVIGKRIVSTTKFTTTEMMDYVAQIQKWASETLDLYIPDPNEELEPNEVL